MRNVTRPWFYSLFALVFLALPLTAQTPTRKAPTEKTAPSVAPAPKASLEGVDAFIAEQMKEWKTPGTAVAVVSDGKVILLKGYGFRDVEKQLPVTAQTLFAIGSITKSFTVTLLGMFSDEGKLDWDKPVREYLPRFQLHDEVAAARATPRDLVTHRTGLPRHDALWYGSWLSRSELFERLRFLEPSKDFRQLYQYNNLMFMTAGILAQELAGKSWEDLVRARIFEPLGMKSSNCSVNDSQKASDFAQPYREAKGKLEKVPFRNIDAIGPAGSINSNIEDMVRYLQLHMNKGKFGEKQLLSASMATQMQSPQMVTPGEPPFPELGASSYGMALVVSTYRGRKVVAHAGAIDGFNALLSFLPAEGIGMVILTNRSGATSNTTISRWIYDRLLGLEVVDWTERIQEQQAHQRASAEEARKKGYTKPREGTRPSHDLKEYVGQYEHPGYGVIRIGQQGNALTFSYNGMTSPLQHFHYDIFEVPENELDPFSQDKVSFFTNVKGDIASLALSIEPAIKEVTFTRRGEKLERSVLESLVGQYVLGAQTVTFALQLDGTLTLTVPGQPTYELVPTRGLSFDLKGVPGFSVEFKKDAAGKITEAVFFQPNGTFVAKRKE
jgi:CubicO group peptidase (beta-lactamase class C family)